MYQQQKQENLEKLKKEMYKELTLKPTIPDTSKTMGISRATARGEDTTLNASERLFREAYEKQKPENEARKKRKEEELKRKTEVENADDNPALSALPQNKLSDAEKEELAKQGFTFSPEINTNIDVDHGDKTLV